MSIQSINITRSSGVTLLDVLLAIVIFAVGMLALAQLQGNVARSSGDSNSRTVATNIGEEIIEHARSFVQLAADPDGALNTYADIVDDNRTYRRGGIDYDVQIEVTNYWFDPDRTRVWSPDDGIVDPSYMEDIFAAYVFPDFKNVAVTVTWNESQEFQIDATTQTADRLGSGSITLAQLIPSYPPLSTLMTTAVGSISTGSAPSASITPGSAPDIMAISMGADNRFKETSTPLPVIRHAGEQIETWLEVMTYKQLSDVKATLLRRDEFLAVSCQCELRIPTTEDEGGLLPTVWTGVGYTDGEFVSKPYGESASVNQSAYCDQCCANHHDDNLYTSPSQSYDPTRSKVYWDSGPLAGDHQHWGYNDDGILELAQYDGDLYEEACRLIRVDGWFRVAQDAALKQLLPFPEGYLDYSANAATYATYVVGAVENWYTTSPASLADPGTPFPAASSGDAYPIPNAFGFTSEQLRSRGIYIDYLTPEAAEVIDCLYAGGSGDSCGAPGFQSWLELYPFFDAQLTWLSRWNENPETVPVDVTNQAVATDNAHDRGRAVLQAGGTGLTEITPSMHKGNSGLTSTEGIDPNYDYEIEDEHRLWLLAAENPAAAAPGQLVVFGTITSGVKGVKAAVVEVKGNNSACSRTDLEYGCLVDTGAGAAFVTVSNYYKANTVLYACTGALAISSQTTGASASTTFTLPSSGDAVIANIVIQTQPCGT